ncbi:MAG: SDR family oxidoreductase [Cyanobacteria bacterium P01_D01_bin.73]
MAKQIVITGVAQGLGRALAEEFIALGHTVHGCDIRTEQIGNLQQQHPIPHSFAAVNLTNEEQVQSWATSVLASGPPDLLINNAGFIPPLAPLWTVPAGDFERAIAVNLGGIAATIRAFVPAMVERRQGVIVNISAKWGRKGAANAGPFCASKWGVEGLTQCLALELPEGMAAVTVAPGAIATEALAVVHGTEKASTYPTPGDWGAIAAPFLLSITPEQNGQPLSIPKPEPNS